MIKDEVTLISLYDTENTKRSSALYLNDVCISDVGAAVQETSFRELENLASNVAAALSSYVIEVTCETPMPEFITAQEIHLMMQDDLDGAVPDEFVKNNGNAIALVSGDRVDLMITDICTRYDLGVHPSDENEFSYAVDEAHLHVLRREFWDSGCNGGDLNDEYIGRVNRECRTFGMDDVNTMEFLMESEPDALQSRIAPKDLSM